MQVQYYGIKIIYARKVSKILKKDDFSFPEKQNLIQEALKMCKSFDYQHFVGA